MSVARQGRRLVALAVAVAFVATGCSASKSGKKGATADSEPSLGEIRQVRGISDVALPLDAYWTSMDDRINAHKAMYLVGADCMRSFGSMDWPTPDMGPQAPTVGRNKRRYGIFIASEVEVLGYHNAETPSGQAPPPRTAVRTPTPLEEQIWVGEIASTPDGRKVPTGGCAQEANNKILNGTPSASNLMDRVQSLMGESFALVGNDSRAREVNAKWSSCMARSGYKYKDIWAANNNSEFGGPRPGQQEIATAKADVACRQETNLTNLMFTIDTAYQNRLIEANAQMLRKVLDYQQALSRGASRVLAGQPVS